MYDFNLKSGSQLEIHSISTDNTVSGGSHSYYVNDATPVSIYTNHASYTFNKEYQLFLKPTIYHKKIVVRLF